MLPSPIKGNLENKVNNYLNYSYGIGYNLDMFFTQKDQLVMFERLLSCDPIFKQEWENGFYSVPEDPAHTMYLAPYVKRQSISKKIFRKINNTFNKKLNKGGKNLLEAYMIQNSQDFMREGANKNVNAKIQEMFCGIFKQIGQRKEMYLGKKVPEDTVKEITGYISGGTKRNTKKKRKTRKIYKVERKKMKTFF